MEPEVSSVEDPAGDLGAVPQPVQPLKEEHHRPGTMICRHSSHLEHCQVLQLLGGLCMYLKEVDVIPVIGAEGVGFVVCEHMYRAGRNPVLLHHKALIRDICRISIRPYSSVKNKCPDLGYFRTIELVIDFCAVGLLPETNNS